MEKNSQINNVLIVANGALNKTGVPCLILELAKILKREGLNVDIIYFSKTDNTIIDSFIRLNVKVWYIPYAKRKSCFNAFLKDHGYYDVLHCFNEYESLSFLSLAKKRHIPVRILHTNGIVHNSKHPLKQMYLKIIKMCINRLVTKRVGCSKEACESAFGNKKDFVIFPNPYDEDIYKYHELLIEPQSISMVQVGSFQPNKNQMFSIHILEKIVKHYPESKLFLIGNEFYKDYVADMKKYVLEHNLVANVEFLKYNEDQIKYFDKSNYMLFPSKKEGFGTALLEAQSSGLKCIASDTVPKTTDFGGIVYLKLDDGPEKWAKAIISDYQIGGWKRKNYNTDLHKKQNLTKIIRGIYAK